MLRKNPFYLQVFKFHTWGFFVLIWSTLSEFASILVLICVVRLWRAGGYALKSRSFVMRHVGEGYFCFLELSEQGAKCFINTWRFHLHTCFSLFEKITHMFVYIAIQSVFVWSTNHYFFHFFSSMAAMVARVRLDSCCRRPSHCFRLPAAVPWHSLSSLQPTCPATASPSPLHKLPKWSKKGCETSFQHHQRKNCTRW